MLIEDAKDIGEWDSFVSFEFIVIVVYIRVRVCLSSPKY